MGFFGNFFKTFISAAIGLGFAIWTGGLSLAGSIAVQFGKVSAIAAAIAGATATTAELAKPDDPEVPPLDRSFTLTAAPARYIYGRRRVPGLLNYVSERYLAASFNTNTGTFTYTVVDPDALNAYRDWIDFLFTIAHHPCDWCDVIYMGNEKFQVQRRDAERRLHFTLIRRDDMTNKEFNRIQREFKHNVWVYDLLDGDTSQEVQERVPDSICDLGGYTVAGFQPAAIMIKVRTDRGGREFLRNYQFNPRGISFVVDGINSIGNNPAQLVPDFYERFLGIARTRWQGTSTLSDIYRFYGGKNISMNGTFTSEQIERAFKSLTRRSIRGSIIYENGYYKLAPRTGAAPTKTIRAHHLAEPLVHQTRQEFTKYANTLSATYADADRDFDTESTGPVINASAVAADGREITTDLGHFMFETNGHSVRQLLAEQAHKHEVFEELQMFVIMRDPPMIGERVNVDIPDENAVGIFIVEQRANILNGTTVLTMTNDPDSVYTVNVGSKFPDLTPHTPTYIPVLPDEPSNLIVTQSYDLVNGKAVVDVTLSWTNPPRNESTYIEIWTIEAAGNGVYVPTRQINSFEAQGNELILQDQQVGQSLQVRLYGQKGGERSTYFLRDGLKVGSDAATPAPATPSSVQTTVLSFDIVQVFCKVDKFTTQIGLFIGDEQLQLASCVPSSTTSLVVQLPPTADGDVTLTLRAFSPWGTASAGVDTEIELDRRAITFSYSAHDEGFPGTISESRNSRGVETPDLIVYDKVLTIAPNKPPNELTGDDLISNNDTVVPFWRKTTGTFIYQYPLIQMPDKWKAATHIAIDILVQIAHYRTGEEIVIPGSDVDDFFQVTALVETDPLTKATDTYNVPFRESGRYKFNLTGDNVESISIALRFPIDPPKPYAVSLLKILVRCRL